MSTQLEPLVDATVLRERVREMYRDVAEQPAGDFHFETGRALAERLGYPPAGSTPCRPTRSRRSRASATSSTWRRSRRARPCSTSARARGPTRSSPPTWSGPRAASWAST